MRKVIAIKEASNYQIENARKKAKYLDDTKIEKICYMALHYGKDAISDSCLNTKIDKDSYISLRNFLNSSLYCKLFAIHLYIKDKKTMIFEDYETAMSALSESLLDDYEIKNHPTAIYSKDNSQPYYKIKMELSKT